MSTKSKNNDSQRKRLLTEKPFTGVDWSNSIQRPGCQDHLKYPSRRGDMLVPHRPPMGMQSALPRGSLTRLVMDLQRIHELHEQ